VLLSLEDAMRLVAQYVQVYNEQRLHSAIGDISPKAMRDGWREQIHAERDRKLEAARQQRELAARHKRTSGIAAQSISKLSGETEAGCTGTQPR
jgi:hypothetical protein